MSELSEKDQFIYKLKIIREATQNYWIEYQKYVNSWYMLNFPKNIPLPLNEEAFFKRLCGLLEKGKIS